MPNTYSDCYFCGGELAEQRGVREIWWQGRLHLVENVPLGVCGQCGQKVVLPAVAKMIDQILAGQEPPSSFVQVPSYRFRETERVA